MIKSKSEEVRAIKQRSRIYEIDYLGIKEIVPPNVWISISMGGYILERVLLLVENPLLYLDKIKQSRRIDGIVYFITNAPLIFQEEKEFRSKLCHSWVISGDIVQQCTNSSIMVDCGVILKVRINEEIESLQIEKSLINKNVTANGHFVITF